MISNNLFEEIIKISERGKLLDRKMIKIIVKEIISSADRYTKRRFKLVNFNCSDKYCAIADIDHGKLTVSIPSCYEEVKSYRNASTLEKNLHILAIILHEVEHLKEVYKKRFNRIEGKLIKLSDYQTDYYVGEDVNYDTYYTDPSEKIAYASSYKKLLEFLINYPGFNEKYFREFAHINNEYIERLKYGYKETSRNRCNTPLIDFTRELNREDVFKKTKLKLKSN